MMMHNIINIIIYLQVRAGGRGGQCPSTFFTLCNNTTWVSQDGWNAPQKKLVVGAPPHFFFFASYPSVPRMPRLDTQNLYDGEQLPCPLH